MAKEQRLIDANELMESFRKYMMENYDKEKCISAENCEICGGCLWAKITKKAPTVDAVEVVRCSECQLCGKKECPMSGTPGVVSASDFCSYGERKDNG